MSQDLPTPAAPATPTALSRTARRAAQYARDSKAPNTRRAYEADLRHFRAWCGDHGLLDLPAAPETVGLYLTHFADRLATTTLERHLSAITEAHRLAGQPLDRDHPAIRDVLHGIRAHHGTMPNTKTALLTPDIVRLVGTCPNTTTQGLRDRALLLLGFASGVRRSALVGLDIGKEHTPPDQRTTSYGWIERHSGGLALRFIRSKGHRGDVVKTVYIPQEEDQKLCPIRALDQWIERAGIAFGPVFRPVLKNGKVVGDRLSDKAVALIVKRAALAARLDPTKYAGHSLRSGHGTQAAINEAEERDIQKHLGHANPTMTRRYIQDADGFRTSTARKLDLP